MRLLEKVIESNAKRGWVDTRRLGFRRFIQFRKRLVAGMQAGAIVDVWNWIANPASERVMARDPRFDGLLLYRCKNNRNLLPADLPGPVSERRECRILPVCGGRSRGGISSVPCAAARKLRQERRHGWGLQLLFRERCG